jgi:LAO/AO transport system kinase
VTTDALSGRGVEELETVLQSHRDTLGEAGALERRRRLHLRGEVIALASARMRRALEQRLEGDERFEALIEEVAARRLDPASAAAGLSERPDA